MAVTPSLLRQGDVIGIVTLGSPLTREVINQRIAFIREMGFSVVLGRYVYTADGFLAGGDQQRAADFMNMVENPAVKMILPTRGGVRRSWYPSVLRL